MKPVINHGEEEWAELMRGQYGDKGLKSDWYSKGIKSVEVSIYRKEKTRLITNHFRINGNYYLHSSKSKVSLNNI